MDDSASANLVLLQRIQAVLKDCDARNGLCCTIEFGEGEGGGGVYLQPGRPGAKGAGAPAACAGGTTHAGAGRSTERAGSPARSHAAQTLH